MVFNINKIRLCSFCLMVVLLSGCVQRKVYKPPVLSVTSFSKLSNWEQDDQYAAFKAFSKSCSAILKRKAESPLGKAAKLGGKSRAWQKICNVAKKSDITDAYQSRAFFEKWFNVYKIQEDNGAKNGIFTGYYEIELDGSDVKTKKYHYPIYKVPSNLLEMKGRQGFCRTSIEKGVLKNKQLELVWVDSKARAFFLHIQGSGVVKLQNNKELKLGYAGQNGFPFTGIWGHLRNQGVTNLHTSIAVMEWLDKNPKQAEKIMRTNRSYVFFTERDAINPIGGQGVELTPERSIAIDVNIYPYGAPFWIETRIPTTKIEQGRAYERLMIAQDTGGAIKGAIRADIFFGRGKRAEHLASSTKNTGVYYILLPKK